MTPPSSRTPEGQPNRCPVCGHFVRLEPSTPPADAPCPHCGHLLWFAGGIMLQHLLTRNAVVRESVVRDLPDTSKRDVFETLITRLADAGRLPREEVGSVVEALLQREELGSTAIGDGIAIPHVVHGAVSELSMTIGYAPEGLNFASLDGRKVHTVILTIGPESHPDAHQQLLKEISRALYGVPE